MHLHLQKFVLKGKSAQSQKELIIFIKSLMRFVPLSLLKAPKIYAGVKNLCVQNSSLPTVLISRVSKKARKRF